MARPHQRKNGGNGQRGGDVQALHDTEWAQAKIGTKHGEKPVEKRQRPPNLREDERDDLENN